MVYIVVDKGWTTQKSLYQLSWYAYHNPVPWLGSVHSKYNCRLSVSELGWSKRVETSCIERRKKRRKKGDERERDEQARVHRGKSTHIHCWSLFVPAGVQSVINLWYWILELGVVFIDMVIECIHVMTVLAQIAVY